LSLVRPALWALAVALTVAATFAIQPGVNDISATEASFLGVFAFAFAAAGQMFPAGDYRVSLDESNQIVSLRGQDLKTIFLLTAPGDRFQDERSVLRFQRDGNEWSLQGVVIDGLIHPVPLGKAKIAGQE